MNDQDASTTPSSPREVGFRFRRPLNDAELDLITAAAKRRGKDGGLDGAFRATWDILLSEAEGVTLAEAVERNLKFHPAEYAIPERQTEVVLGIWRRHRGRRHPHESTVAMLWLNLGPGSYPEKHS